MVRTSRAVTAGFLAVALLLHPQPHASAQDSPRVITTETGIIQIDGSSDGTEQVKITDLNGQTISESFCNHEDTGSYDQIVATAGAVQRAVRDNDLKSFVAQLAFPLQVNEARGKGRSIKSAKEFNARADQILTPALKSTLLSLEPRHVFCRNGMAMVGSGAVWMGRTSRGEVRVSAINQ